ncbi:hypothetical protein ASPACDRAFT_1860412 [Aspergillus aculeatus ATCC 16872]|uniref:Uncharacterized protein n=1 Tax=Aspergillus aculeatus (strain ATCC 16872 / CBS 172.66 / WB 5094) TaxID=690307 RepID=A0A1L9WFS1_ASPA1|nr:uncharacterized protein ASPACDRAFT_1860412 [Aspergillus aculeatus ATCC 16872]OJJ95031.1 hypothetical protein ASPACDRAFT_1860412 [Aspergillus aculeatus ATCC 16872]
MDWACLEQLWGLTKREGLEGLFTQKILCEISEAKPGSCSLLVPIIDELEAHALTPTASTDDLEDIMVETVKNLCHCVMSSQCRITTCQQFLSPNLSGLVFRHLTGQELIIAVCTGRLEVVRALLSRGCNVNSYNEAVGTPLFAAFELGRLDIARLLLDRGANANIVAFASNPLAAAAMWRDEQTVKFLLTYPTVDVNVRCNDGTPLFWACQSGNLSLVEILLRHLQIDWRIGNEDNVTPLGAAAGGEHLPVVQLFFTILQEQVIYGDLVDPLWKALVKDDVEIVQLILDALGQRKRSFISERLRNTGLSMLWWATSCRCSKVVRLLLQREDVDPNGGPVPCDREAGTPLSEAVKVGEVDFVQLLLQRADLDPNILVPNIQSSDHVTTLYTAVSYCEMLMVDTLLGDSRVDANASDSKGQSPLSLAVQSGEVDIVARFLSRPDVKVNDLDMYKRSAVSYAAEEGCLGVVELLLHRPDADVSVVDTYGYTPIFWASIKGEHQIVRCLRENDASLVSSRTPQGDTCLMCAAKQGWLLVVMVLIEFEADPAVRDSCGRTALAWAVRNKHDAIQSVLHAYILRRELPMRGD